MILSEPLLNPSDMFVRNKEELETLREAGKILHRVLDEVEKEIRPGVSTDALNNKALEVMRHFGVKPSFLNYKPYGHKRGYPAAICTSVNDEVVHGIPNENPRVLKEGDIITIDSGLWLKEICTDSARTVKVGKVSAKVENLINVALKAREAQIKALKAGVKVFELGKAVEELVRKSGYSSPDILGGHGVGRAVHEDPFIPNFYDPSMTHEFKEGEVLALEPIVIMGRPEVYLEKDGYTYKTKDGSWTAQFEHTVIVWEDKAEVIT